MITDSSRQPLPGIKALFGIDQRDNLSKIPTIPAADALFPRHLDVPRRIPPLDRQAPSPYSSSQIPKLAPTPDAGPSRARSPIPAQRRPSDRVEPAGITTRAVPEHSHRRVSSASSVSPPRESYGQQHVVMRVQQDGEFSKELLAAKYECQYCGKRFNRPSSLKIHVNTHTGEKPYKCTFPSCGRRFSVMSNMRRHSRVHASAQGNMNEWRGASGSDDDESVGTAESSSVSGSPRLAMSGGVRRTSPLARMHPGSPGAVPVSPGRAPVSPGRMHPYAHARPESPPTRDVAEMGLGQSAALFRLPLVPNPHPHLYYP